MFNLNGATIKRRPWSSMEMDDTMEAGHVNVSDPICPILMERHYWRASVADDTLLYISQSHMDVYLRLMHRALHCSAL